MTDTSPFLQWLERWYVVLLAVAAIVVLCAVSHADHKACRALGGVPKHGICFARGVVLEP